MRRLLVTAAAALLVGVVVPLAGAGTPAVDCASAVAIDQGTCEVVAGRLDELTAAVRAIPVPSSEISGTVALADGDSQRLDLIWVGVAFLIGVTAAIRPSGWLLHEFRKWGGGA